MQENAVDQESLIRELRQRLDETPADPGVNRRMMLLLAAEDRKGEALLYGMRGAEFPAQSPLFYRSLVRILVDLGLPCTGALIALDRAKAKVIDEKTFLILARALRRKVHDALRRTIVEEGLKQFPNSSQLQECL